MAKLIKVNNRWEWQGTFEERLIAKNAGFRWESLNKVWYTYDDATAYKLKEYIVEEMKVDIDNVAEAAKPSYAVDTEFMPPAPEGLYYRPYQRAGIEYMYKRESTLLADPPGTGKTIQVSGLLNTMYSNNELEGKRVLIVAPASMTLTWERELHKWLVWKPVIHTYGASKSKKYSVEMFKPDISIFSYERLSSAYKDYYIIEDTAYGGKIIRMHSEVKSSYDVVILDEAHFCKSEISKRTMVSMAFASEASKKVFMTGTPMLNRPIELWPLISTLDGDTWSNRNKFATYFCNRHLEKIFYKPKDRFTGAQKDARSKNVWVENGAEHIDELNSALRTTIMIRRDKSQVLSQLPEKTVQTVELPITCREVAEELDAWKTLCRRYGDEQEALTKLLGGTLGLDIDTMAKVRQNVALAKVPYVAEFVSNYVEQGEKVIVMAHHKAVVDALMEAFAEHNPVKVVGGMSAEDKQKSVDSFQKDVDTKVFVGNIRAAGVGLTLTASSTVVFAELDFTPGVMEQCEDRAHRIGQKHSVNVFRLVLKDSLDSYLLEMLKSKSDISEELLR